MRRARLFSQVSRLATLLATLSVPLSAQWQFAADLGASRLQRTDIPQSNAVTFGGSATGIGERAWFRSSLLGVVAGSDQVTAQGLVTGSLLGPSGHPVRGELNGFVSSFSETGGPSTVSGELMARGQFGSGLRGGALGLGAGTTSRDGVSSALYHAAGDAWWAPNDNQFAGNVSVIRRSDTFVDGLTTVSFPRSYVDLIASWRRDHGGIVLGASAGVRAGIQSGTRGGAWGSADATAWVSPRSAIVVSGGRSLDDPVRGIPRTTYLSLALRVTGQRHLTLSRRPTIAGARVSILRVDDASRRIEVRGVTASRIEVMGDFTDWSPVALEMTADVWRLERAISPGLHRIAIRIDGGEWIAPVNLPRATDDLGGVVGLVTVP
jgi:hypothetical protein